MDDIGTRRQEVCSYLDTELKEARDHADNRGGYVVDLWWRVVFVSEKADVGEIATLGVQRKAAKEAAGILEAIRRTA